MEEKLERGALLNQLDLKKRSTRSIGGGFRQSGVAKILFCIGLYLTVFQQFPIVRDNIYGEIRILLYCLFGALAICSLLKTEYKKLPFLVKLYALACGCLVTTSLLLSFVNGGSMSIASYSDIVEMIIPFGILLSSLFLKYSEKQIYVITSIYVISTIVMGVCIVFYYQGSWVISSQYFLESKNQIGPILAISCITLAYFIFKKNKENSAIVIILSLLGLTVLFSCLLVLRSRGALLSVLVLSVILGFQFIFSKKRIQECMFLLIIILIIFSVGVFGNIMEITKPIYQAFTLNYEIGNLESLSAGRMNVYADALNYVKEYPFLGDTFAFEKFPSVTHNYVLNKCVRYGIVVFLPGLIFYFYLWIFALKKIFLEKTMENKIVLVAPMLLLMVLITSIFEYSHPFGPGVSQIFVWFLLGQYLRLVKRKGSLQRQCL